MDAIVDRSRERLGTSAEAIIAALLLEGTDDAEHDRPLGGLDPAAYGQSVPTMP
jgi:hypothetical protein